MRFDVVTLFPELFVPFLSVGITRRAFESGQVDVHLSNPREFASGNYRRVDDRPFGGGPGMVMMAQPLEQTLVHIRAQRHDTAPVVLFSPIGQRLDHAQVQRWSAGSDTPRSPAFIEFNNVLKSLCRSSAQGLQTVLLAAKNDPLRPTNVFTFVSK